MKTIVKCFRTITLVCAVLLVSCEYNFDNINDNPNQSTESNTSALFSQAIWNMGFNNFDVWYGGRQSLNACQQWAQRSYTSEDRYAYRPNVMDGFFRNNYIYMTNLQKIIALNNDPVTKEKMKLLYGDNRMQIVLAEIVKVWSFQLLTDAFGDIPYAEALNLEKSPQPKYDSQKSIYDALINALNDQLAMLKLLIKEGVSGYSTGDLFYKGDLSKWYKFGNSLKLRLALRASSNTVRATGLPDAKYIAIANEAIDAGVFEDNSDNAQVHFSAVGLPNEAPMYNGFYTEVRNDFTMTDNFVTLLKGDDISLINFTNPFGGVKDPRWKVYAGPNYSGADYSSFPTTIIGIPYGLEDAVAKTIRPKNLLSYSPGIAYSLASKVVRADFPSTFLDYPTVCFMISEVKGNDVTWFLKGVRASLAMWGVPAGDVDPYVQSIQTKWNAATTAGKKLEMIITQKYIHLYMQGYEAWAEYRRTGFPKCLVKPGQKIYEDYVFEPVSGNESGADVVARFKYPSSEFTLNKASVNAALLSQGIAPNGGDAHAVRMWWAGGGKQ